MKQLLLDFGWYKYTSCTCGGSYKEKYKHPTKPSTQIHIQPNANKWLYRVNNSTVQQGVGEQSLQTKLKEI